MDEKTALSQMKRMTSLSKKSDEMRLAAESWGSDYEILISTIMSARTRDEVTIPTAEKLFQEYPSPESLAKAKIEDVEKAIKPVNFYRNKAKNIVNCAKALISEFDGKVPHDIDLLVTLPGVGRKTANVFLAEVGKDGIGVDTHVAYISKKLNWTDKKDPKKIEEDLKNIFSRKNWSKVNSTLVRFGKTHTSRKEKDSLLEEIKKIK